LAINLMIAGGRVRRYFLSIGVTVIDFLSRILTPAKTKPPEAHARASCALS